MQHLKGERRREKHSLGGTNPAANTTIKDMSMPVDIHVYLVTVYEITTSYLGDLKPMLFNE